MPLTIACTRKKGKKKEEEEKVDEEKKESSKEGEEEKSFRTPAPAPAPATEHKPLNSKAGAGPNRLSVLQFPFRKFST